VARILVVEDDETIGRVLSSSLDLGLPDMDGVDLCRRLRVAQPGCVLVVLTAREEEIDVVLGLEAGADDYLTKPFRLAELLARVQAHLRRGPVAGGRSAIGAVFTVGSLQVDGAARRAWLGTIEITLRAKEFDLLARLSAEPGAAISRSALMADVWDENWFGSTKTLDVHIAALRRKLALAATEHGGRAPKITTLRSHGFRLESG
jgi:DNA-binding response OmpR family regulator